MFEVCCVVFVRLVCHSARHTRPGDERPVYHPKNPTRHVMHPDMGSRHGIPTWDPTLVCDPPHGAQHGALGVSTWRSRWHVQRTHAAHSHVRARKARARAHVRMSVHCEPLPSRSDASLAPHCAALGFEFAAARFECCADSAPSEAAHLRCARGTDRWHGVCRLPSNCCVARACCALSARPSSASWHDRCRWAARQMLMRSARLTGACCRARGMMCRTLCDTSSAAVHGRRTLLSPA